MKINLSLQQDVQAAALPLKRGQIKKTIETTLRHAGFNVDCEIGIACVDTAESQQLNLQYREKDKPTNVLSFPSDMPEEMLSLLDAEPLGDLVICIPVVLQEAEEQQKKPSDHFTHLLVHGILHLLGYDHETSELDAEEMEALEVKILKKLGVENPYQADESE